MDDCDAAAWWQESAGDRLTVELLRRGGEADGDGEIVLWCEEAGGPELEGPPEPDTDATIADTSPAVFRLGDA
jgi:hypothetical protein